VEIGAILFSLAMILIVAAYVLQPLSGSERGGHRDTNQRLSALQAERDRVFDSIQEIDMDHSMGKVPEEHYLHQRQELALEGAEVLRKIDELQLPLGAEPREKTPEMELEAAVARLRGISSPSSSQKVESNSDSGEGPCPECGQANFHGDRFCANCGVALEEQVA
jgi:hypothetical protein